MPYNPIVERVPVTIANGATVSSLADLGGGTLVGIENPTVTAASYTFKTQLADGSTMALVTSSAGTPYSITATDAAYIVVDHVQFYGVRLMQVIGNTVETGGVTVTLQLVVRPVR